MKPTYSAQCRLVSPACCLGSQSTLAAIEMQVHKACHRYYPCAVILAVLPVTRRQAIVHPQAPDLVLHNDPPPRERCVVRDILRWSILTSWLAPWCCPQASGV